MSIRLETSKGRGIENSQGGDLSPSDRIADRAVRRKFPQAKPRTDATQLYNCHGMTFASRRSKIFAPSEIAKILTDDSYVELTMAEALPGDIVVYFSEMGEANHSATVVEYDSTQMAAPVVCSKWGFSGEFIHGLSDCPTAYGPQKKFYRCRM